MVVGNAIGDVCSGADNVAGVVDVTWEFLHGVVLQQRIV